VVLTRQFGRTWQAGGAYHRGVGFIEGLTQPVLTDGLSVTTTGFLTRRVDFTGNVSYSVGEPFTLGETRGFTTYGADARLRLALNRDWAIFGDYRYYYYDFSQSLLPAGLPRTSSRNGLRGGLMLWLPF
jgi:hypothetical protein